jgi:transposase-like protein
MESTKKVQGKRTRPPRGAARRSIRPHAHSHPYEVRRKAIQLCLEEGFPAKRVAREMGVGLSTLTKWVRRRPHAGQAAYRSLVSSSAVGLYSLMVNFPQQPLRSRSVRGCPACRRGSAVQTRILWSWPFPHRRGLKHPKRSIRKHRRPISRSKSVRRPYCIGAIMINRRVERVEKVGFFMYIEAPGPIDNAYIYKSTYSTH